MLTIKDLHAWYGRSHVLQGVDLDIARGEMVALIGRNGAGKTTTLKAIMGLLPNTSGSVTLDGAELLQLPAHERFARGIAYVPEERRIVRGLSVLENLRLGLIASPLRNRESEALDKILVMFPRLKERLQQNGMTLSGGEQQMLAIARALVAEPKLVLVDEPMEGIMPLLVEEIALRLSEMRQSGQTILLVEQNVELALRICDRAYIMDQGAIVHSGPTAALLADVAIQERYCTV
jgi:branched-chain amino acid transport system ATP-binding protein